jgi:capsular exopolysaccharide synthesis family protein
MRGYPLEDDGDEVHLRDYWRAVRKRLWMVLGITALVTAFVAIYVAKKPDIYQSQARVQVDTENSQQFGASNKTGSVFVGNMYDPAYFNTQLQNLTGQGLLRRVVKTLDLEHNQAFLRPQAEQNRSTWQSVLRMVGLGKKDDGKAKIVQDSTLRTESVAAATSREDLVEAARLAPYVSMIQLGLKVDPVKDTRVSSRETRLIDIRCTHPDPQVAAKIVNAIADTFVLSNLERKTETNNTTGDFLQKRIAELQSNIRSSEERLINYAKNNQILSLDASQNTVVERLSGLNRQLLEAENERKTAEAAYRAGLAPGAADALASENAKQAQDTEGTLAKLKQRRSELLVENTEEWPEVKEINQQIATLEGQVKEVRGRATSVVKTNLETRYRQALAREQSLRADFNRQRGETLTQNEAAINYRIIQQEIETNKTLLDGLLQRSKENDVVLAGTPNNIYVVDYAIAPAYPIGPARLRTVFLSLALSLAFGVGLAILLEYLDDTIRSTEDVEKMLHLPALAVIPTLGGFAPRRFLLGGGSRGNGLQLRDGGANIHPELLIGAGPRSQLAEAYAQLRTSVLLSTAGRAPQALLVTSSMPAEGKTTTAINTALSLAQTGASVVIIDADMRRPRLHNIFEIENQRGLSSILSREMSEAEVLSTIDQHPESKLYLLPSGPIPPNPAELLGSDQMRWLVESLRKTFTHIVIDSPPTASFTDSVLISSMVDGVILVVHGGKSTRDLVRRTRQVLSDVGAKIFGVVLNNVKLDSKDYYYYQGYYNRAYYNSVPSAGTD